MSSLNSADVRCKAGAGVGSELECIEESISHGCKQFKAVGAEVGAESASPSVLAGVSVEMSGETGDSWTRTSEYFSRHVHGTVVPGTTGSLMVP
jgi:hypothetical protein